MAINEVFPHATVKKVIFQIRFPNLFSIENRIGDYQIYIMSEFPESGIAQSMKGFKIEIGPDGIPKTPDTESVDVEKVWQFKSEKGIILNVDTNSLTITSEYHKTYMNPESDTKFRDIIEFAVNPFLEVTRIPVLNRIGLRYIDECPIKEKTNASFTECYNSVLPITRFSIEDSEDLLSRTVVKKRDFYVNYLEHFRKKEDKYILVIDSDAYQYDVKDPSQFINISDTLHEIISTEFEETVNEPVFEYMRKGGW